MGFISMLGSNKRTLKTGRMSSTLAGVFQTISLNLAFGSDWSTRKLQVTANSSEPIHGVSRHVSLNQYNLAHRV